MRKTHKGHAKKVIVTGAKTDRGKFAFLRRTGNEWNNMNGELVDGDVESLTCETFQ